MSEYKRLTERYIDEQGINCVRGLAWDGEILHRLAELEDKIENGTLVVVNKPFVAFDYISNGKEYYAVKIAEERDLAINLTKAEAEAKLKELQEKEE